MNQEVAFEVMGAALQTVTAQVGLWPVTRGDASHLDCRPGCIPRMSHAAKIGFNGRTISLGLDRSCRWRPGELHRTGVRRRGGTAVPIEENRAVARRVLDDLVSQGRFEVVDQIYAQAFEFREPTAGLTITRMKASGSWLVMSARERRTSPSSSTRRSPKAMRWCTAGPRAGTLRGLAGSGSRRASRSTTFRRDASSLSTLSSTGWACCGSSVWLLLRGSPQPEEFDWASSSRTSGAAGRFAVVPAG